MKHKLLKFSTLILLLLTACGNSGQSADDSKQGTKEFRSPKGDIIAVRTLKGADTSWTFYNALGEALVPGCESVEVVSTYPSEQPKEVLFNVKGQQTMILFYDNMEKWCEGRIKNGLRDGHWTGYDQSTGQKQSETDYVEGLEHGSYTVYNYNGTPRIIGQNNNGKPTGEWTIYDQDGNFVGTKQY